jgi:hypothetical protein
MRGNIWRLKSFRNWRTNDVCQTTKNVLTRFPAFLKSTSLDARDSSDSGWIPKERQLDSPPQPHETRSLETHLRPNCYTFAEVMKEFHVMLSNPIRSIRRLARDVDARNFIRLAAFFAIACGGFLAPTAAIAEAPAFRLDLKPAPGLPNGRVAAAKAIATPKADRFFIPNVFVLQPVVVSVFADNPAQPVKVTLGKDRWDESLMSAVTGADGKAILKLRTQGEVRISVSAESGRRPYKMLAWVGDEVKVVPESAVMPMSEYRKTHPESWLGAIGPQIMWAAGGALIVGVAVAAFFFIRRRGAK